MKNLCLICFYLYGLPASAQITEISDKPLDVAIYLVNLNNPKYEKIEGSPYLNPGFSPAKINGSKETKFVRFNPVDNNIEIRQSEDKVIILSNSDQYNIILLDGSAKEYQTLLYIDDKNDSVSTFFELINKGGDYNLYLKERIKLIRGVKGAQGYSDSKPDRFLKVDDHFYVSHFGSFSKGLRLVPTKKKEFYKLFETHSNEMEKYIKKEKLAIDQVNDLMAILDHYESIHKGQ